MVMKITCVQDETVKTNRMIMFATNYLCGYDLEGKLFLRNMTDVVAIDMVENEAKPIPVTNFHTFPEK